MDQYPHIYKTLASSSADGPVAISGDSLPVLETTPPPEFGGPPGYWSPETLLSASVADCFILTFRAIARGSRFEWSKLDCEVEAVLDRVERVTRFKSFNLKVRLTVPVGADEDRAHKLLHKAETLCLITNSLNGDTSLEAELEFG